MRGFRDSFGLNWPRLARIFAQMSVGRRVGAPVFTSPPALAGRAPAAHSHVVPSDFRNACAFFFVYLFLSFFPVSRPRAEPL